MCLGPIAIIFGIRNSADYVRTHAQFIKNILTRLKPDLCGFGLELQGESMRKNQNPKPPEEKP
jgi:hypothetical protein